MSPAEQTNLTFKLLKKHLKERKLSYASIAKRISMSESNLKRIFASQSCSFERLSEICAASDSSIFELVTAASNSLLQSYRLAPEAEEFFAQHMDGFFLYRELSTAPDIDTALKTSRMPKAHITFYLKAFDKLNLLRRQNGKWQRMHSGYLKLDENSKIAQKLKEKWAPWFINHILNSDGKDGSSLHVFSTGLSKRHRAQLLEDLAELRRKYHELGRRDQRFGMKEFEPVGVCIGVGPYRVGVFASP